MFHGILKIIQSHVLWNRQRVNTYFRKPFAVVIERNRTPMTACGAVHKDFLGLAHAPRSGIRYKLYKLTELILHARLKIGALNPFPQFVPLIEITPANGFIVDLQKQFS